MAPRSEGQASAPRIPLLQGDDAELSNQPDPRSPTRDAARTVPRGPNRGGVVVKGRDGEVLSRSHQSGSDQFDFPLSVVPPGWSYQWNAVSVVGNTEVTRRYNLEMWRQGWRPVPADRHPGRFMPLDYKGDIVVDGMRLEERPIELSREAQEEEYRKAYAQMRDRDEALMGSKANLKNSIGDGLELRRNTDYKGRRTQLSIDNAYDVPPPAHAPADDSVP
jgi:hypothetical protein